MYHFEPHGRYVIQVCEGLSCHLAGGAEDLAAYLSDHLGIAEGETTADGLFTLQTVQCLAACGSSPAMRVNDTLYDHLTTAQVDLILTQLREWPDVRTDPAQVIGLPAPRPSPSINCRIPMAPAGACATTRPPS
jgi:hypothetical protein